MFRTLHSKLSVVLFFLVCLIGFIFMQLVRYSNEMYQQEVSQKLNTGLAAGIVHESPLIENGQVNQDSLEHLFHMLMVINPSIEIYLLDTDGEILAFSAPPGKVKRKRIDLQPVHHFLNTDSRYPLLGDDPRHPGKHKVFSAAPVPAQGTTEAYLYVILGGEAYDSIAGMIKGSYSMRTSLWGLTAGLLVALLAGVVMLSALTRRLRTLSSIMSTYNAEQETLPRYQPDGSDDEIGRLGASYNAMAERIEQQMQEASRTDSLRRELIANVSHDLRTPLASLNGYLETLLLKAGKLSQEESKRYLEIAVSHSKRLASLVDELFELAKLDACETPVNSEPFTLGELVHDVAQKFQLAASKANINFELAFDPELPFAFGDVGMMQRVLENLIENALRHTPAGGTITLALSPEEDRIQVQIADTGCGIPEEDLPHIFDRFYRQQKSRPGDNLHAGLGLAIAKRIMELHGSSIDVCSALNKGTTFSFRLPSCSSPVQA